MNEWLAVDGKEPSALLCVSQLEWSAAAVAVQRINLAAGRLIASSVG